MTNTKIRLATASPGTQATTRETLVQLHQIAKRAAANNADILLLPEAYIGGYPRGLDFGCKIGARSPEGREDFLQYFKSAVDLGDTVGNGAGAGDAWVKRQLPEQSKPGAPTESDSTPTSGGDDVTVRGDGTREEIERIARETGVFIVVGLIEKAGGSLYCAVGYVCPTLGFIGKRRKVQPTGTERLIWAAGSPATLKAVSTRIRGVRINLAAAICWENYMPLLRQSLYAQNINLWLAPTADNRDAWMGLMRTVALEGRCFVVSSNMCVPRRGGGDGDEGAPVDGMNGEGEENKKETKEEKEKSEGGFENVREKEKKRVHEKEKKDGEAVVFDDDAVDGGAAIPPQAGGRRRASCLTEEGFEIALPSSASPANKTAVITTTTTANGAVAEYHDNKNKEAKELKQKKKQEQEQEQDFISRGGSAIIAPDGEVVAGPQWEDHLGLIYADVDFEDCIRGRLDLDAAGSYSRNDSFKFSVEGLDLDPLPY